MQVSAAAAGARITAAREGKYSARKIDAATRKKILRTLIHQNAAGQK
jgi:hypothetical protein